MPAASSAWAVSVSTSASAVGRGAAQQLYARLPELALLAGARLDIAEDAARITEALRQRRIVQACADEARYGDRHVGAQRQHAAVAIQKAAQLGLEFVAAACAQRIGVLERGRHDIAVTPRAKNIEQRRLQRAPRVRFAPEIISNPGRHLTGARPGHGFDGHNLSPFPCLSGNLFEYTISLLVGN
jgi:hypothetical protein